MTIRRTKRWKEVGAVLEKNVRATVYQAGLVYQQGVRTELNKGASRRGATPSAPGQPPHKDTSLLAKSWQINSTNLNDPLRPRVRVGSNLPYARIHEYGGVITAKGGGMPVPLNDEARSLQRRSGGSIRGLNLTPIKTKAGKLLLVKTTGKGTRGGKAWKAMFVVVKSIRMPMRPYVRPAVAKTRARIRQLFSVRNLIGGIKGVT